jgi:hypothetical protein
MNKISVITITTMMIIIAIIHVLRNAEAGWLALLLRIHEVPVSNLFPKTGYSDRGLVWFSSIPAEKWRYGTLNYTTTAFFLILYKSLFIIILSFDSIKSELLGASLNKPQINKYRFSLRRL